MSTRTAAFLLATSAAVTVLPGCSTVEKATQGAKEDWARMTAPTPANAASAPETAAPAAHTAAAPAAKGSPLVHPFLTERLNARGAEFVTNRKAIPLSFDPAAKCSRDVLAGGGPGNPATNRFATNNATKQGENAVGVIINQGINKLPSAVGRPLGSVTDGVRASQSTQANATQAICGTVGKVNASLFAADDAYSPNRKGQWEQAYAAADSQVEGILRRAYVAGITSAGNGGPGTTSGAIITRGTDKAQEQVGREILNKVYTPKSPGGVLGDVLNKFIPK